MKRILVAVILSISTVTASAFYIQSRGRGSRSQAAGQSSQTTKPVAVIKTDAVPSLIKMLAKQQYSGPGTPEFGHALRAARLLGDAKDKRAEAQLTGMLADRRVHPELKANVVWSLGRIDADGNQNNILKAYDSPDTSVKLAVVEALSRTTNPQTLAKLKRLSRTEEDAYIKFRMETITKFRPAGRRPS